MRIVKKRNDFVRSIPLGTFITVLIVLMLLYVNTYAQDSGPVKKNITGYVKDTESGEALVSANIVIKGTYLGAASNVDGYFVILNVPVGICSLQVSYIGYETKEIAVNNKIGGDNLITIKMNETSIQSEEIVITADANTVEIPKEAGQIKMSPRKLYTLPSLGEVDILRSLQLLPGISAANDGSSGLYVRGGTPDQNLIMLDGMTIYHVDHFFGFFSAFNAEAIKDIKMYKGGFPAEYGGRISSVVNLTGKTGNENEFSMGIGANLLSGNIVTEVPISEKVTFLLSARRSYTDFIQSSLYNDIYGMVTGDDETDARAGGGNFKMGRRANAMTGQTNPKFHFYDMNSKITFRPTNKDIFALSLYYGKDFLDKSQNYDNFQFKFPGAEGSSGMETTDFSKWGNTGVSGKWSRKWNDRLYSHLLAATSSYFSNYENSSSIQGAVVSNDSAGVTRGFGRASKEDNEVKDLTLRFDNELSLTNSHKLKFGLHSSRFQSEYKSVANDTTVIYSRESDAMMNSFYLQDNWKLNKSFDLTLGVRSTHYDETKKNYFEPRASFMLRLTDGLNFKGAWGHYFQFVNRITNENVLQGSRDFWILADENLKPSFSEHRILGLSYENKDYLFDVEGYYKNLNDLIEYSQRFRRMEANTPIFTGDGIAKGIDFLLQKKRGRLSGWIGYTLGRVEYDFQKLNNGEPYPAEHDRTHELTLVSTYKKGLWNFSATWIYASGKAYTSPESQYFLTLLDGSQASYIHVSEKNANRLPSYQRLDLSVSRRYEFNSVNLDVGASIFNTYNHKNVSYREYNLDLTPVVITDVTTLGFTPTVYFRLQFK